MEIRDQLGRKLKLLQTPRRIISLVPSQSELLSDLGLEEHLVGVTHFCVHPTHLRKKAGRVGGTKKVNLRKIRELEPDLILCNKEENTREMVEQLEQLAPVHVSDVGKLEDVYQLIVQYGEIFDREAEAGSMVGEIKIRVEEVKKIARKSAPRRVAYFIWNDPLMVAGKATFINEMLQLNNFINAYETERYPVTSLKELEEKDIDLCMLSSEPFPFKDEHKKGFAPYAEKVEIVDGEYFSWYGSRLLMAMEYFKNFH